MSDASIEGEAAIGERKLHVWRLRDYMRSYIGPSWEDYVGVFDEMKGSGLPASWSWTVFFFPWIWMAYRKRYWWAVGGMIFDVAIRHSLGGFGALLLLLVQVYFGVFGKAVYVQNARACTEAILGRTKSEAGRIAALTEEGGVSDKAVVVVFAVIFASSLLGSYLRLR